MIRYYKTINLKTEKLNSFESGCWINLVEPDNDEIEEISTLFNIDIESISAALDYEERSRIEIEENYKLILFDIPLDMSDENSSSYITVPLSIILVDEAIITVCNAQSRILNDFIVGHVKDFFTFKKSRFVLQILYKNATYYLLYLRRINMKTNSIEKEIHKSMKNKEIVQLLQLEKSLVYFTTSLTSTEVVLEKLTKTSDLERYPDDDDLLEDVIIENKQALDMSKMYGNVLSRIMDAYSAIINNNQNNVMKLLAGITIIMSVPTIVSGFAGMNVGGIPFAQDPNGYLLTVIITTILVIVTTIVLYVKNLL